jgi:hypothetical protein
MKLYDNYVHGFAECGHFGFVGINFSRYWGCKVLYPLVLSEKGSRSAVFSTPPDRSVHRQEFKCFPLFSSRSVTGVEEQAPVPA